MSTGLPRDPGHDPPSEPRNAGTGLPYEPGEGQERTSQSREPAGTAGVPGEGQERTSWSRQPAGGAYEPDPGRTSMSPGGAGPSEGRGDTRISDRVLEQIAARAVCEVDHVGGAAPRVLGVPLGRDAHGAAPRVSAHVEGNLAIVHVTMSVDYPAPIRQVVHRVRDRVTTRVHELTGLDARQVDIDVARLVHPAEQGRRLR